MLNAEAGFAPTVLATQTQGCLGCDDCQGSCLEIVEMVFLPGIVLRTKGGTR